MASEEGKGKEGEGKRGKVFGRGSSMDKRTTRNRDTREGCGAKHLAAQGGHGGVGCSRSAMLLLYRAKDEGPRLHTGGR